MNLIKKYIKWLICLVLAFCSASLFGQKDFSILKIIYIDSIIPRYQVDIELKVDLSIVDTIFTITDGKGNVRIITDERLLESYEIWRDTVTYYYYEHNFILCKGTYISDSYKYYDLLTRELKNVSISGGVLEMKSKLNLDNFTNKKVIRNVKINYDDSMMIDSINAYKMASNIYNINGDQPIGICEGYIYRGKLLPKELMSLFQEIDLFPILVSQRVDDHKRVIRLEEIEQVSKTSFYNIINSEFLYLNEVR